MHTNTDQWKPDSLYYCGLALAGVLLAFGIICRFVGIRPGDMLLPCLFHSVTGIYCPGCGGTRACIALLRGNVRLSLHYHPVVLYAAVLYGWYMISNTIQYISRGKWKIGMAYRSFYAWIGVVILALHALWANAALLLYGKVL